MVVDSSYSLWHHSQQGKKPGQLNRNFLLMQATLSNPYEVQSASTLIRLSRQNTNANEASSPPPFLSNPQSMTTDASASKSIPEVILHHPRPQRLIAVSRTAKVDFATMDSGDDNVKKEPQQTLLHQEDSTISIPNHGLTGRRPCSRTISRMDNIPCACAACSRLSAFNVQRRRHRCRVCSKSFSRSHRLRIHSLIHIEGAKPQFPCPHCNKAFFERGRKNEHVKLSHEEKQLEKDTSDIAPTSSTLPQFQCMICQRNGVHRIFTRAYSLRCHLRIHTGYRPFVCQACNRSYVELSKLKNHQKRSVACSDVLSQESNNETSFS